jgi:hypothetical protein
MRRWFAGAFRLLSRLPALLGVAGSVGAALPAQAAAPASLEARVAEARCQLAGEPQAEPGLGEVAQANQWNNWPNFNNWANWANG